MAWSRLSLAFLLVAFGHFAYVLGELDPIAPAAFFDTLTIAIMLVAAWKFRDGGDDIPWGLAIAFGALALVKTLDLLTSFLDGLFLYHIGFFPIVIGTVLLAVAGIRSARGSDQDRALRLAAALNAFGSIVYFGLALESLVADGETNTGFLVGALAAAAGWAYLASRDWTVESDVLTPSSPGTP